VAALFSLGVKVETPAVLELLAEHGVEAGELSDTKLYKCCCEHGINSGYPTEMLELFAQTESQGGGLLDNRVAFAIIAAAVGILITGIVNFFIGSFVLDCVR
jgi:hypothetical protein